MNTKRGREYYNDCHRSNDFRMTSELEEIRFKYDSLQKQYEHVLRDVQVLRDLHHKEKVNIIDSAGKEVSRLKEVSSTEMEGMKKCMNNAIQHLDNQNRVIHFLRSRLSSAESACHRTGGNPFVDNC